MIVKTDDVTKGRKDVDPHGGYGRFRGEWVNLQAPVVRKLDSAIHRINLYPVDNY